MGFISILTIITQFAIALHPAPVRQKVDTCAGFQQLVKATYGFKPSRLSESEQTTKSAAMDRFWEKAKSNPKETLPCLRAALQDPNADKWFRFDASNLLVEIDPSTESKAIQVGNYAEADLDDVNLQIWVSVLVQRALEGSDVSDAGARWLAYRGARYSLPEHGGHEVDTFEGALFIFGSMDESQATPALLRLASQTNHPGRDHALRILMDQATPESLRALRKFTGVEVSSTIQARMRQLSTGADLLKPRSTPKTSREEFIRAFKEALDGDASEFMELVSKIPDGEKDVIAVLKPEDLPLVRKVRRLIIAGGNQNAIEYYNSFTEILLALVWRPEFVK